MNYLIILRIWHRTIPCIPKMIAVSDLLVEDASGNVIFVSCMRKKVISDVYNTRKSGIIQNSARSLFWTIIYLQTKSGLCRSWTGVLQGGLKCGSPRDLTLGL